MEIRDFDTDTQRLMLQKLLIGKKIKVLFFSNGNYKKLRSKVPIETMFIVPDIGDWHQNLLKTPEMLSRLLCTAHRNLC